MFVDISPNFNKGQILKKEMLESIRDYPREFINIYFKDFSEGIISGTDLVIDENYITITKGIVKHKQRIYTLEKDYKLPYKYTNVEVLIKIKFLEESIEKDFTKYNTEIFLDNKSIQSDEIELGRFKLREGAVLRSDYKDFYDFATEYNTINIINSCYSAPKNYTLNPKILRYFSNIILKNKGKNIYDINFAMECINKKVISRKLINYYISNRLEKEYKDYSNEQIYKYLSKIVREIENKGNKGHDTRGNRTSRIIVD